MTVLIFCALCYLLESAEWTVFVMYANLLKCAALDMQGISVYLSVWFL